MTAAHRLGQLSPLRVPVQATLAEHSDDNTAYAEA